MKKGLYVIAIIALIATFTAFIIFINTKNEAYLSIGVAALSVCYQFSVRLCVGSVIGYKLNNEGDYDLPWFQPRDFEAKLYKTVGVKKWKDLVPTADPEFYSIKTRSFEQIASVSCQYELTHEVCVLAGFLSLLLTLIFGNFWVFFVTSVLGALADLVIVSVQRYNRPRLLKTAEHKRTHINNKEKKQ